MQKNMAMWDRIGRVILGIVFILLAIKHGGMLFDLLGVIGLVFLVTAAIGFCPLYTVLGFKTGE
ncbi:MAG: YgaP family membrane protein [Hydrogenobaculum sp.]